MIGYVLGLGDRHFDNILLDQQTGEVIHIDYGVAFDDGAFLKVPERVPFRLTQNCIDGMGVTGVEGPFRLCCEKTLSLLRKKKKDLLHILDVLCYEPLFSWSLKLNLNREMRQRSVEADGLQPIPEGAVDEDWAGDGRRRAASNDERMSAHRRHRRKSPGAVAAVAVSKGERRRPPAEFGRALSMDSPKRVTPPAKINRGAHSATNLFGKQLTRSKSMEGARNRRARALLMEVHSKLEGRVRMMRLDVRAHVDRLISDATSADNLCQMFRGWRPWL